MMSYLYIATILILVGAQPKCPIYTCSGTAKLNEICLSLNANGTAHMGKTCPSTQLCSIDLTMSSQVCTNKNEVPSKRLAGDLAYTPTQCYIEKMSGNICLGLALGAKCSSVMECDVGLICSAGTCLTAKKKGESCDLSINFCHAGLYCSSTDLKCYDVANIAPGAKASRESNNIECQSFWLDHEDKITCTNPPHRTTSQFMNLGETCLFTYENGGTKTYSEPASCGFLKDGMAICDPDYTAMSKQRATLTKFLKQKTPPPCHVIYQWPFCEKAKAEMTSYSDAVKAYYDLNVYNLQSVYITTVGVDKCFYGANREYHIDSKGSIASTIWFYIIAAIVGLVVLSLIFELVIILCLN